MGKRPKLEVNGVLTKQGLRAITCANLLLCSLPDTGQGFILKSPGCAD